VDQPKEQRPFGHENAFGQRQEREEERPRQSKKMPAAAAVGVGAAGRGAAAATAALAVSVPGSALTRISCGAAVGIGARCNSPSTSPSRAFVHCSRPDESQHHGLHRLGVSHVVQHQHHEKGRSGRRFEA